MRSARRSARLRIVASLLLLWVGFDLGAHGLLASDFPPIAASDAAIRVDSPDGGAASQGMPDHCFCHGVSVGAVVPTAVVGLAPAGVVSLAISSRVPGSDGTALDHPPQLLAA